MKAKKWFSLVLVVALLTVALAGFAQAAVPSPEGWTIRAASGNVKVKQLEAAPIKSETAHKELVKAASDYAAKKYADDPELDGGYDIIELVAADINIVITGNEPGEVEMKIAGANLGDRVFAVVRYPNGKTEVLEGIVVSNGVVKFKIKGKCSIAVFKVVPKGQAVTVTGDIGEITLPATGDKSSLIPMAALLVTSVGALAIGVKLFKKSST